MNGKRGSRWRIAAAIAALTTIATTQSACQMWCDPDNEYCDLPEPTRTPAAAIRGPAHDGPTCDLEDEIGSGRQYWGVVTAWTGPTTVEVTHLNESADHQPDIDEANLERRTLTLWAVRPGGPAGGRADAIHAATAPPGSWVRIIASPEDGRADEVALQNHHGWDVATILALGDAVRAAPDAPECMWTMTGERRRDQDRRSATHGAGDEGERNYPASEALAPQTAGEKAQETGATGPAQRRPTLQPVTPTAQPTPTPPEPTSTATPTETPAATPEPPPILNQYGTPPDGAMNALVKGETVNLAGCAVNEQTVKTRKRTLMTGTGGLCRGRNAFALYHQEGLALPDGACYEIAADPLDVEEWQFCADEAYGGPCDARRDDDSWSQNVPAFRYAPNTLRAIGRAWGQE